MSDVGPTELLTCVDFYGKEHRVPTTALTWRPSAYAVIIRGGKLLLTRQAGSYNLPGGGVEFGEMPEEAVVREVFEETGIKVKNPRLITCKSNLFKCLRPDNIDEFIQSILLFYACDYAGGKFSIDRLDEHEQTWTEMPEWVPIDKLDDIKRGSSYEWRDVVKQVALLES